MSNQDLKALLILNLLGRRREVVECLEQGMAPGEVMERLGQRTGHGAESGEESWLKKFDPEKEIKVCEKLGVRLLTWFDTDYPRLLKEIYDPPLVVHMKGNTEEADDAAVAIVGTRHPSLYGRDQAKKFSRELVQSGLTIVSGFAKGIDQAAHEAAIEISYGRTIAVLGCGIDVEYPRESRKLSEKIAERGAVLSEYPLGTQPRAEFFPKRNRIISGLSLGVLVIEAASKSGSLITAHEAIEQGREVFALPGRVDWPTSRGTHHLLKEGAALAESPADVLEALALPLRRISLKSPQSIVQSPQKAAIPSPSPLPLGGEPFGRLRVLSEVEGGKGEGVILGDDEHKILNALESGPIAYDQIIENVPFTVGALASLLMKLQLERKIEKLPDGRFALVR